MLRKFKVDFGRYKAGDVRDLPGPVWNSMIGIKKLNKITEAVDPAIARQHEALGAAAQHSAA